jgi:hypothetical protein
MEHMLRWVRHAAVLLLPACFFHPNYDHPACGPHGECPSGFTCSAALVCENGSSANPPDPARAIFVDGVSGSDTNPGTMQLPRKTITSGIEAAVVTSPRKYVYVSKGIYPEMVTLNDGVSLYGGYDAANGWSEAGANATIIRSPMPTGIIAQNLQQPTEVKLFQIVSADAKGTVPNGDGDGETSVGIRISNATQLTIRGCSITAGNGSPGAAGASGAVGAGGSAGGAASGTTPGGQGGSTCGVPGGVGGAGVSGTRIGSAGGASTSVAGGGSAVAGGPGGAAGTCDTSSSSNGSSAPPVGANGGPGAPGANGAVGSAMGILDGIAYRPPAGGNGAAPGHPGGGGGGGGAGGGTATGTNTFCTDCSAVASGAGGGGGGGGCGGAPGAGGRGGGASLSVTIFSSTVIVEDTQIAVGAGGAGGDGGDGGNGGGGGSPGPGAPGQRNTSCVNRLAGNGASGSAGGAGGKGGGGGGGTGGASICILYMGTAPLTTATNCTMGTPGAGGQGGGNGIDTAPSGLAGVGDNIRGL